MEKLTKADISNIIDSPQLSNSDIVQVVQEELNITISENLDRDQMVNEIYKVYTGAIKEIEKNKDVIDLPKPKTQKTQSIDKGKITKKQFIINLIKEGKYHKAEIVETVISEFSYGITGKSPKTRISKVIRELKAKDQLDELADGILRLKEC